MVLPIITLIGIFCSLIAIILLIIAIYKGVKDKEKEIDNKLFIVAIVFMAFFAMSSFFVKYEIKYYIDDGYIVMKSLPSLVEPKYEEVEYDDISSIIYDYTFRIDQEQKIIYMSKKGR